MDKFRCKIIVPAILLFTFLFGCAGKKAQPLPASAGSGSVITIEAGSYSFNPSQVNLAGPGSYTLQVANTTGSETNLTLKNPRGQVIKAINTSPKGTSISVLDLTDSGIYEFHSDKRFRSSMGMKGRIVVGTSTAK
ncbi:MAG: hypothetical protein AAGU11_05885 [Syntrophobacteraceae bacterium]